MENKELISILESIAKLSSQVSKLSEKFNRPIKSITKTRSDEIHELSTALAKAQGEIKIAGKNSENPFYKSGYSDLAEVVNVSRPFLTKNGLSVVHQINQDEDGANFLHTTLLHTSGQWIGSKVRIVPAKGDIQSFGSAVTYLKRYSYAALVGVVSADEDDDGESEMQVVREEYKKGTKTNYNYNRKKESFDTITKEQLEELRYELSDHPELAEEILDRLKIQHLSDLPKSKFLVTIRRIREIVQARENRK